MRDHDRYAREFGRRLAEAAANASLQVEGAVLQAGISTSPVRLAPLFVPLDPLQTWMDRDQPRAIPATLQDWAAQRVLLPLQPDPTAARVLLASVAGCQGTLAFEALFRHDQANVSLAANPDEIGFFAAAWQLAYPDSIMLPVIDPLLSLPFLPVVMDVYHAGSYDACLNAPVSLWGQCSRLASLLGTDAVLLVQVLFQRVTDPWHQNILILRQGLRSHTEAKALDEPLFAAVVRFATTNPSLASGLANLVGSFTAAGQLLAVRSTADFERVIAGTAVQGMFLDRSSYTLGMLLTSSELGTCFVHPPSPEVVGTVQFSFLRGLRVPKRLQQNGIVLGTNTDRGEPISVHYPDQYNSHAVLVGTSGKGKSAALANWIVRLAEHGAGLCLLDPHRQTAQALPGMLATVKERVVYLDFDDPQLAVAYNPFASALSPEEIGLFTGDFVQTIGPLLKTEGFVRLEYFLRNGIHALFALGRNLASLPVLFSASREGQALRSLIVKQVTHEPVLRFWRDEYDNIPLAHFAPIPNRVDGLFDNILTWRTFCQQENKLDFAQFMREGKVVIVALPTAWEAARIVGGFFIGQLKHRALRRQPTDPRFFLIADELHRFSGVAFQELIDQTTKGKLSLWLAHQNTEQLPKELSRTIFGIDHFVFGSNGPDAKLYAGLFDGRVTPETLRNLGTGSVYARIGSDLVNFECPLPLVPDKKVAAEIISASRAAYYATANHSPVKSEDRPQRIIETFDEE